MKLAVILALVALTCVAHASIDESKIEKRIAELKAKHGNLKISGEKLEQYKKVIDKKMPATGNKEQDKIREKLLRKVELMHKKMELIDAGNIKGLKELLTSKQF